MRLPADDLTGNCNRRTPWGAMDGWAFVALTAGALAWIAVAFLAQNYALLAQNIAVVVINGLGIYRWLIWNGNA